MTIQHPEVVLKVLQEVNSNGFVRGCSSWSIETGLSRTKRFLNWLLLKLGADHQPFEDPCNFRKRWDVPASDIIDIDKMHEDMVLLAGEPACKRCGNTNLQPDPAGYYVDAERWDGAPLLCPLHGD